MKKIMMIYLLIIINIFSYSQVIDFAIGEWPPFTGEKAKNYGIVTEIVSAVCEKVDLKPVYNFYPWYRAEKLVIDNEIFGTFPYKMIPERIERGYVFSDSILTSIYAIAYNTQNSKTKDLTYEKIEDLKGYRIGIIHGIDAVKFPLLEAGIEVDESRSIYGNLFKLLNDRIDIYIDDKTVILYNLQQSFSMRDRKRIALQEKSFGQKNEFRMMMSSDYPNGEELMDKFNKGLKMIKEDGTYEEILKEYK